MFDPFQRQPPRLGNLLRGPWFPDQAATVFDPEGLAGHMSLLHVQLESVPEQVVGTRVVQTGLCVDTFSEHTTPPFEVPWKNLPILADCSAPLLHET